MPIAFTVELDTFGLLKLIPRSSAYCIIGTTSVTQLKSTISLGKRASLMLGLDWGVGTTRCHPYIFPISEYFIFLLINPTIGHN